MKIRKLKKLQKAAFRHHPNVGVWMDSYLKRVDYMTSHGVKANMAGVMADTAWSVSDAVFAVKAAKGLAGNKANHIINILNSCC